ncbi:MAG: proton-conducting transporter transmembrane domain-containing protein, partial [Flavitalea sp.]
VYFVLIYVFSNLAAFGVISLVSTMTGKESISDYKGFYQTNPMLSWILTIALFSLAGVPPTAGFFGKFFLLIAGAGKGNYLFITIAALNIIISFYYYLRIVKAIFMDTNTNPIEKLSIPWMPRLSFYICAAGIIGIGFIPWIYDYISGLSISI